MPIDFSSPDLQRAYAARVADESWLEQMRELLAGSAPGRVADIGCGGGIYTRAWRALGAEHVFGIDASAPQIAVARRESADPSISYVVASAYETGLPDASQDVVFSRAVIHHLQDHAAAMAESMRILAPGGVPVVQDRTIEDVLQPASAQHFRAVFFEAFPRLLQDEYRRRPDTTVFAAVLQAAGFIEVRSVSFWETRTTYRNEDELRADLLSRKGRSILHELTDAELHHLSDLIAERAQGNYPLAERDRWTMWTARKPGG